MNLIKIGKLIEPEVFEKYADVTLDFPEVIHRYGSSFDIPNTPCWMTYKDEAGYVGDIGFSKHTDAHPILSEMVSLVVDILKPYFNSNIPIYRGRVHFIRTRGNIPPHKDEAGRNSCINIGLKNSSGALTKMSTNNQLLTFNQNHETFQLQDGYGYLMNTAQFHGVESLIDEYRYLITYGFEHSFDYVLSNMNINKNDITDT